VLPPAHSVLIGLEIMTGARPLGSVMSVMQIVARRRPARLASARPRRRSRSRATLGSSIGASAFGALIYGLIGGAPVIAGVRSAAADARIDRAFEVAFLAAAALCLLAAWAASRVPTLRFDGEQTVTAPAVE
jgi:hypothetical protein